MQRCLHDCPTNPNPIAKSALAPEAFASRSEKVTIALGSGIFNVATNMPKISAKEGILLKKIENGMIEGMIGCVKAGFIYRKDVTPTIALQKFLDATKNYYERLFSS